MRFAVVLLLTLPLLAQVPSDSSIALVLASKGDSVPPTVGSAVAIRSNGILLTSYRMLKDAHAVQVRLKSGEVFDQVQLLGIDARRDVAAIKITGTLNPPSAAATATAGDSVSFLTLSAPPEWSVSNGSVSAYVMADEVAGGGKGYRLIRFSSSANVGTYGGVLLGHGALLGLVVAPYASGSFAVPIDSVAGLADAAPGKSFERGNLLKLPSEIAPKSSVLAERVPSSSKPAPAGKPSALVSTSPTPASNPAPTKDRRALLRDLKTIFIDADAAKTFDSGDMKTALLNNKVFQRLNVQIVDDPNSADVVLKVRRTKLFTDYPFEVRGRSEQLLLRGTALGYTGDAGSRDVAILFSQMLNEYRPHDQQAGRPDPVKYPADRGLGVEPYK